MPRDQPRVLSAHGECGVAGGGSLHPQVLQGHTDPRNGAILQSFVFLHKMQAQIENII